MPRQQLYERVADDLRRRIEAGEFARPGQFDDGKLPSRTELAEHYGVSDTVTDKAMAILRGAGLVETLPGRGVYTTEPPTS